MSITLQHTRNLQQDALHRRILRQLANFSGWLTKFNVLGYIGEVGWSNGILRNFGDASLWNAAAEAWYQAADAKNLWVTAHTATERELSGGFWLTIYTSVGDGTTRTISVAQRQAAILEAHLSTASYKRGINVNGAEATQTGFYNGALGTYDTHYWYPSQATFNYLYTRGIRLIRLPFRWERIQPTLGGVLNSTELTRLTDCVGRAGTSGHQVVLDVHNYAGYYTAAGVESKIGSAGVTQAHFADLWTRLSVAFSSNSTVLAYGLMNEPFGMSSASAWEAASQAALNAIRANGDTKLVMVPGYNSSAASTWQAQHPLAWITDSASNYRYQAHHYWPNASPGQYNLPYASELDTAVSQGY